MTQNIMTSFMDGPLSSLVPFNFYYKFVMNYRSFALNAPSPFIHIFASLCFNNYFLILIFLKMSDVDEVELEPGETLEARISSCRTVLQRPKLTDNDRGVLQRMLTAAQACQQKKQGRAMSSLLTKYGVAPPSDVIEVDESPAKEEKATRKSKIRDPEKSPKLNKKARTDTTPAKGLGPAAVKKVKGPPTKRKVPENSEPRGDDSDVDVDVGSDYQPSTSENESDVFATPSSKKKRGRPASAKKSGTGSRRRLPWASSDSDTESQARGGITYTEDELAAMYNTAQEDP